MRVLLKIIVSVCSMVAAQAVYAQTTNRSCPDGPWYCVVELNPGLEVAPGFIDRTTPRATMESLVATARRKDWAAAAHLLDLSGVLTDAQAEAGPELAKQLEAVITRKAVIDWDTLIDRPDALEANTSSDEVMAGKPRKSLLLWTLDLDRNPVSIRLNRVAAPDQDPIWVFSSQTVGDIPALYARYSPGWIEKQLPDALKKSVLAGFMWWELLVLPILICVVTLSGMLTWRCLSSIAARVPESFFRQIVRGIRGPAATGVATGIALPLGANIFVFSGHITAILTPIAWFGLLISSVWLVISVIEIILDRLLDFENTDLSLRKEAENRAVATRVAAARRIFIVVAVLIGGGIFLSQTNTFRNLGLSLLGTAGALTIVLGFAARRVLGNIMASLQIALNQSARIGDRIVFNDYLCHVERINFTYVQLRDWDGTRLIVPVEEFTSTPFENWSMKEPQMLRIIKLKVAHEANVELLREAFKDIVGDLDQSELGDLDKLKVRVAGQDVFGKDVWFALPCADPNSSWDIACIARERLIAAGSKIGQDQDTVIFPDTQPAEAP